MQIEVGPTILFLRGEDADRIGSDHNVPEGRAVKGIAVRVGQAQRC